MTRAAETLIKIPVRTADSKKPFTTGHVAALFGVAPRTVTKWTDCGALKAFRIPGSQDRRIMPRDLLQFAVDRGLPIEMLQSVIGPPRVLAVGFSNDELGAIAKAGEVAELVVESAENSFEAGVKFGAAHYDAVAAHSGLGRVECRIIASAAIARARNGATAAVVYGDAADAASGATGVASGPDGLGRIAALAIRGRNSGQMAVKAAPHKIS